MEERRDPVSHTPYLVLDGAGLPGALQVGVGFFSLGPTECPLLYFISHCFGNTANGKAAKVSVPP